MIRKEVSYKFEQAKGDMKISDWKVDLWYLEFELNLRIRSVVYTVLPGQGTMRVAYQNAS